MKPYAFFQNMGGSSAPGFELGYFEDDMRARVHALWMLKRNSQYASVEVWDGIHEPFIVDPSPLDQGERSAAPPMADRH